MGYASHLNPVVPQSQPLPGQVPNSGGGFSFGIDKWARLDRFLVLGSDGGSYYAGERELTVQNVKCVEECLAEDGVRVVARIVEVSEAGRAPKNDPALVALAIALKKGKPEARAAASNVLPRVARTGTHLFHLAAYVKALGGWGRGTKRAFSRWYTDMPAGKLALQAVKYQSRDGFSHRDVLRLSHPAPTGDASRDAVLDWMVKGWPSVGAAPHPDRELVKIWAFEQAKTARGANLIKLIEGYGLPHECVPNDAKNDPAVWEAMLPGMGLTALVRNLGKMTSVGLVGPLSAAAALAVERLRDLEEIRKARLHPLSILVALRTYAQGHGDKGKLSWEPVASVVDALDGAFYAAFKAVEPTGKRTMLALDCSDSMTWVKVAGMPITPREAVAAMALVTANVEPQHFICGFSNGYMPLTVSPRQRLDDVVKYIAKQNASSTDCAAPMLFATKNGLPVDVFVIYTDNETNSGAMHPTKALAQYRKKTGIPAKLVTVAATSTGFTIADPNDAGQLDVVGFDTSTPAVIADFARS
jgi:60 kDa SS-A/Ro ribonucleoprotein